MIPVMIVPILTNPGLLHAMIETVDYPTGRLIIIDNGRCVDKSALPVNENIIAVDVITMPANLGVAGSWNLGIKAAPFAEYWLIANFDVRWPAGALECFDSQASATSIGLTGISPAWCAFTIGCKVVERVGLFDEFFHPGYFEDDDYWRRCLHHGVEVTQTSINVHHGNSSTLNSGYTDKNNTTFYRNQRYFQGKVEAGDFSEGRWSVQRRRDQSWD